MVTTTYAAAVITSSARSSPNPETSLRPLFMRHLRAAYRQCRMTDVPNGNRPAWTDGQTTEDALDAATRRLARPHRLRRAVQRPQGARLVNEDIHQVPVSASSLDTNPLQCGAAPLAAQRPAFLRPQMSVPKRTARARGTAYAPLMGSPHISAPSCPHCRGTTLRNTRPSRSGCYRICSGCNHLWHVTGEALRAEKAPLRSRRRVAIPTG